MVLLSRERSPYGHEWWHEHWKYDGDDWPKPPDGSEWRRDGWALPVADDGCVWLGHNDIDHVLFVRRPMEGTVNDPGM